MDGILKAKIWGTRGSFPAPFADRLEYGGNTTCISVECGDRILVLDAGSGLAGLGEWIVREGIEKRIDLFISHVHLDHIIGIFNFRPFFIPGTEIHIYGESKGGQSLRRQLGTLLGPPYWPVGLDGLAASIIWHEVGDGDQGEISRNIRYRALHGNHPDRSLMYRLEIYGKTLLYSLDSEVDDTVWEEIVAFSRGCGLLICDGQYPPQELAAKKGWGHSSWKQAVALREAAGAGRVLVTHYGWEYTDCELAGQETEAGAADSHCIYAREGMEVLL